VRGRRPAIRRLGTDAIEIDLPRSVIEILRDSAHELQHAMDQPDSPAVGRLLAQVDESAEHDDPVVTLSRQTAIDETIVTVLSSWHKRVLSDAEAESWLRLLGLVLSVRAAELGVHTEGERAAISRSDERFFQLVYVLQLALIEALDGGAGT
jgi:hypothetical protein